MSSSTITKKEKTCLSKQLAIRDNLRSNYKFPNELHSLHSRHFNKLELNLESSSILIKMNGTSNSHGQQKVIRVGTRKSQVIYFMYGCHHFKNYRFCICGLNEGIWNEKIILRFIRITCQAISFNLKFSNLIVPN